MNDLPPSHTMVTGLVADSAVVGLRRAAGQTDAANRAAGQPDKRKDLVIVSSYGSVFHLKRGMAKWRAVKSADWASRPCQAGATGPIVTPRGAVPIVRAGGHSGRASRRSQGCTSMAHASMSRRQSRGARSGTARPRQQRPCWINRRCCEMSPGVICRRARVSANPETWRTTPVLGMQGGRPWS